MSCILRWGLFKVRKLLIELGIRTEDAECNLRGVKVIFNFSLGNFRNTEKRPQPHPQFITDRSKARQCFYCGLF